MIKLKDLTCEKCFYARRSDSSFAVSEKLVEYRRHPNAAMKTRDFGCGEGSWNIHSNKKSTDVITWYVFSKDRGQDWLSWWEISVRGGWRNKDLFRSVTKKVFC